MFYELHASHSSPVLSLQVLIARDHLLYGREAIHEVISAEAMPLIVMQVGARTEHIPRLARNAVQARHHRLRVAQQRA